MTEITSEDIELLLLLFSSKGQYDARTGEQGREIHTKCEELFEKDYICSKIENEKGSLSANYPSQIIIPVEEKSVLFKDVEFSNRKTSNFDASKFKEIANKSNVARCRTRFPVPVILVKGKFICRSATLACGPEMLYRDMMTGVIFNSSSETEDRNHTSYTRNGALFTELRSLDIKLLKELSVSYICDLMVENKKVKYGLKVSSSEKVDKENRYCDFKIIQLPYPGCEFFKKFKDNNYTADRLFFDWEQDYVDALLTLPTDAVASSLGVQWSNYKQWDLARLTQNYLKLLITYITEGTSSILIHCISGWDRTPLFVSLLRLSMWADGQIHSSLSPVEIAYLTLAYDWYLFGHDLPSRLKVGEEILFFCFDFLKFITSDEFSSKKRSRKVSSNCTDPPLDILIEEEMPEQCNLKKCGSNASFQKYENGSSSIFYASLESQQDSFPTAMFYSAIDSGEDSSDSFKSVKSTSQTEDSEPSTIVTSSDSCSSNLNNGIESHNGIISSSPVPVPHARPRIDSMSSLGSWQYVSGTGSLLGSVTSKSSSTEINSNESGSSSHTENGNVGSVPRSASNILDRNEKLKRVRELVHIAYRKIIENKETSNGERYYYFPWRR